MTFIGLPKSKHYSYPPPFRGQLRLLISRVVIVYTVLGFLVTINFAWLYMCLIYLCTLIYVWVCEVHCEFAWRSMYCMLALLNLFTGSPDLSILCHQSIWSLNLTSLCRKESVQVVCFWVFSTCYVQNYTWLVPLTADEHRHGGLKHISLLTKLLCY